MLVNFKAETYSKLQYLAKEEGKSVAAFVSSLADRAVEQKVLTTYTTKQEETNPNE